MPSWHQNNPTYRRKMLKYAIVILEADHEKIRKLLNELIENFTRAEDDIYQALILLETFRFKITILRS
jgi:hypothetical protein